MRLALSSEQGHAADSRQLKMWGSIKNQLP
jgi:hypothetical protein